METDSVEHFAAPLGHERSSMIDCSQNLEVGLSRAATLPATLPNDKTPDCWQLQPKYVCHVLTSYCPPKWYTEAAIKQWPHLEGCSNRPSDIPSPRTDLRRPQ